MNRLGIMAATVLAALDVAYPGLAPMQTIGERGDIIKRMHRALTERGIERGSASYVLAAESLDVPAIGRLVERGLDDELRGTAYVVVDGVDGRTHHIKLPHLDAAGDSSPGSIVELRSYEDARGERRIALAVRSDLDIHEQVTATGATWLDRQAVAREPIALSEGGSAPRCDRRWNSGPVISSAKASPNGKASASSSRRLLDTLRDRELSALGEKLAGETGLSFNRTAGGEYVAGIFR